MRLFSIVLHTTGVKLLPFPIQLRPGRIGDGSIAADVFAALQRGGEVTADLGNDWDFWKDMALPLEAVRQRFGVRPIVEPLSAPGRTKPGVVLDMPAIVNEQARARA